jgi:hypothetical protein
MAGARATQTDTTACSSPRPRSTDGWMEHRVAVADIERVLVDSERDFFCPNGAV